MLKQTQRNAISTIPVEFDSDVEIIINAGLTVAERNRIRDMWKFGNNHVTAADAHKVAREIVTAGLVRISGIEDNTGKAIVFTRDDTVPETLLDILEEIRDPRLKCDSLLEFIANKIWFTLYPKDEEIKNSNSSAST